VSHLCQVHSPALSQHHSTRICASFAIRLQQREVETFNAGFSLKQAIENSDDKELKVKLCTAIDAVDAHAIDIRVPQTLLGPECYQCPPQEN